MPQSPPGPGPKAYGKHHGGVGVRVGEVREPVGVGVGVDGQPYRLD